MKIMIIILISLVSFNLFGQIHLNDVSQFDDKPEKYLMPQKDTMDVIKIAFTDIKKYTMNVGKFCAIIPVVVDDTKPKDDYFLPHRILYDENLKSIWNLFNTEDKAYLKISTKSVSIKEVNPIPIIK